MDSPRRADVAIVGAGPTGLVAAIRLAERGVGVRILDRATEPAQESRAALVHAATIEILGRIGVGRTAVTRGRRLNAVSLASGGRVLARIPFDGLDSPFPFALSLPQDLTEAMLIDRLAALGVEVDRGIEVTAVAAADDGCRISGTDRDGRPFELSCRYVVGADGKNGALRAAVGIGFDARPYHEDFLLADVELDPSPAPDDEARLVFAPEGVTVFGLLPSGRHRIIATAPRGSEVPPRPDRAYLDAVLAGRGVPSRTAAEPVWSSRFRIAHGIATRFRAGRALLAGDAAHVHSPAAGQGMNTGIADAYDLAERIAAELAGSAGALDGYEAARMPAAREVVRFTDRMTRAALLRPAPARGIRDAALARATALPLVRRRLVEWVSGIGRSPLHARG